MHLQQINDIDVINSIITNPDVNGDVSDDFSVNTKLTVLPNTFEWLGVYDNGQLHGLYALVPQNGTTAEIHTCLLPHFRGKKAFDAGRLLLDHLFSKYQKAISYVPEYNRKAKLYAQVLGFTVEGINRSSYLKNNRLIDQFLVGLTKEEYLCQSQQ
ncbi:DUF2824 family protein [uncultured Acinetobacter sp.]|uniref:DUF2824 family protein n=1 Tax=uncultured Acinetobacter sp. TaxID=165433 RepID=UPI00258C4318|nr:DUF2824 family protein [uncultured Acinetobacter sp.]